MTSLASVGRRRWSTMGSGMNNPREPAKKKAAEGVAESSGRGARLTGREGEAPSRAAEDPVSVERPRIPSHRSGGGSAESGAAEEPVSVERPRSPSHRLGGGSRGGKPRTTGTSAPSYVQLVLRLITYSLEPCSKKRRRRDVQSAVLTVFWGHGGEDQRGQFTIHYRNPYSVFRLGSTPQQDLQLRTFHPRRSL